MTTFSDFPDMGNDLRLIGSCVMDREQFEVEHWHEVNGELRPTVEGIRRYSELRRKRREERHEAWKNRQEADDAWSAEIERIVDRTP